VPGNLFYYLFLLSKKSKIFLTDRRKKAPLPKSKILDREEPPTEAPSLIIRSLFPNLFIRLGKEEASFALFSKKKGKPTVGKREGAPWLK
jgi:hypothetical protein